LDFHSLEINPQELADRYLGQHKIKGSELNAKHCPFCGPNNKKDNQYKFFLNLDEGTFKCHREKYCGRSGSFIDLLKHFGEYEDEYEPMNKKVKQNNYPKFDAEIEELSEKAIEYMKKRDISEETLRKHNVKTLRIYGEEKIAFEYYKEDDYGVNQKVAIKYRNFGKGENKEYRQVKGGMAVLWELEKCDSNKTLIITEGEIDKLALNEAGIGNVTSVPFGSNNFKWVENNWDKLQEFKEIIVCPDNDAAGKKFSKQALKHLGEDRTKIATPKYPDLNHQLYKEGKESLVKLIDNAEFFGKDNLLSPKDIEPFDATKINSAASSIMQINRYIRGYREGEVSIWTGINGSGKSVFLIQEAVFAVEEGMNVVIINGENMPARTNKILGLQIADANYVKAKVDRFNELDYYLPADVRKSIDEWIGDRLKIYDNFAGLRDKDLMKTIKMAIRRYNTKYIIIDNLMKVNFDDSYQSKYDKQAAFVNECKDLAQKYNCHIHIVAHPRKPKGTIITKEDVAGLYEVTNLADNVFCIHRIKDEEVRKALGIDNPNAKGAVEIFKNRTYGRQDIRIQLGFEKPAERFYYPGEYELPISWKLEE